MSRHPEVLWAQRSDKIYLTVSLPDAKDVSISSDPQGLFNFSATGGPQKETFGFNLELYGAIIPEGSKTTIGLRNILCILQKEKREWWPRLIKSEEKPAPYIKVDWNRWCDEDEEQDLESDLGSEDDNDGENDDSSDDDNGLLYLPDLEKARRN